FLIEGSVLYRYTGTGSNWSWSTITPSSLVKTEGMLNGLTFVQWDLDDREYDRFTPTNGVVNLLFEVERPGALSTGVVYQHVYSSDFAGASAGEWYAENDQSNIYYHVRIRDAFPYNHVFIDSDMNPATGFPIGYSSTGADYLI